MNLHLPIAHASLCIISWIQLRILHRGLGGMKISIFCIVCAEDNTVTMIVFKICLKSAKMWGFCTSNLWIGAKKIVN
jgi:hypothetical protein